MRVWWASVVAAACLLVAGVAVEVTDSAQAQSGDSPDLTNSIAALDLHELIGELTIVNKLNDVDGYDRSCSPGRGCSFGSAWTDDYEGPGSHNGCDTRSDVLTAQLSDVTYKPGTRNCKVQSGTLHDPYTGQVLAFTSSHPSEVQIDHVFPLARAWRAGASQWPLSRRVAFANDVDLNLLAVAGSANQAKSDQGLDTWVPENAAFVCEYARRYLSVAHHYQLAVTRAEVSSALAGCT